MLAKAPMSSKILVDESIQGLEYLPLPNCCPKEPRFIHGGQLAAPTRRRPPGRTAFALSRPVCRALASPTPWSASIAGAGLIPKPATGPAAQGALAERRIVAAIAHRIEELWPMGREVGWLRELGGGAA